MHRRALLKGAVAGAIAPLFAVSGRSDPNYHSEPGVRIMVPPDYNPPVYGQKGKEYTYRLGQAVLDYIQKFYSGKKMPIWGCAPEETDLEKRITNIAYWVGKGTAKYQGIYPLDPAWIMAQIMAESFFHEFAISSALAVGICQFISSTAERYGLVCADQTDLPPEDLRLAHLSSELDKYYSLWDRLNALKDENWMFGNEDQVLRRALNALNKGEDAPWAKRYLHLLGEEEKLINGRESARQNYTRFLEANFEGRSIFDHSDLKFLNRFDQRVTYTAPIMAMSEMMAAHLKERQGNILTATAGYNAGLGNTRSDSRLYAPFGFMPSFEETVAYVSRIAINHHQIISRI